VIQQVDEADRKPGNKPEQASRAVKVETAGTGSMSTPIAGTTSSRARSALTRSAGAAGTGRSTQALTEVNARKAPKLIKENGLFKK